MTATHPCLCSATVKFADRAIAPLNAIPYWFIALVARAATFTVFWRSGTTKDCRLVGHAIFVPG